MEEKEIWKTIPIYDGTYCISNMGRIFRTFHYTFNGRRNTFVKCRFLKPSRQAKNCFCVNIDGYPYKIHRLVAMCFLEGYSKDMIVDHIDRDFGNNRLANLRMATSAENSRNMSARKNTTSAYKGVSLDKKTNKYHAYIMVNYKRINIGYFNSELEAAKSYDEQAMIRFGEFACTNKMLGLLDD